MAWRKSPPELIEAFERALPANPAAQRRQVFGFPCCYVNGNMFAGLHQESMFFRLDAAGREELLRFPGAVLFEPMPGRVMKEYVVVPPRLLRDRRLLAKWIARAFDYASSLTKGRANTKRTGRPKKLGTRVK